MSDRRRGSAARRGFSLIELLIVISIILIIITMAVPKFNQAKRFANETGAISAIRSIHEAQVQYQSQYGDLRRLWRRDHRRVARPVRLPRT